MCRAVIEYTRHLDATRPVTFAMSGASLPSTDRVVGHWPTHFACSSSTYDSVADFFAHTVRGYMDGCISLRWCSQHFQIG